MRGEEDDERWRKAVAAIRVNQPHEWSDDSNLVPMAPSRSTAVLMELT